MNDGLREQVKAIFEGARSLPSEQREAFIQSACADRPNAAAIAAEVRGLLAALESAEGFLEGATGGAAAIAAGYLADTASERVGSRIGPYKLLELIGEGGFGEVYMAEQEQPIRRRVALKIIKLGMDTKQVIARFEQERQALAMMDHPCIAKVLDAGATPAGRPYFVMELVRGEPITKFCDEHRLSVAERIDLFRQVCGAVQHAHQKGIIHRDIKPSNVLVTIADGDRPLPKVIDFGIAKATHSRLTEKTLFTEFRQMIGTPEYMSPEQCGQGAVGGLDIDTRSDVYSLGVLLYELLTGVTPFDSKRLRSAAFGELQRIIREDDPPRPSTRLSTLETLRDVATHRRTEPSRLTGLIRGELDWVVMRCLEKDRVRRYLSANDLSEDLSRFLRKEPLQAGPPGAAYRTRKFITRHRRLVVTAAAVIFAMLLGLIGTSTGAVWALRERNDAVNAKRDADRARGEAEQAARAEAQERSRADLSATQALGLAYRLGINNALGHSRIGDLDSLRLVLEQVPTRHRGWEWDHLRWRSDMSVRTLDSPADTCAICSTPDGRLVVTRTPDGLIRLFDQESGLMVRSFATSPGCPVNSNGMITSPDGELLLISYHAESTHTRMVSLWRLSTAAKLWERDIGGGVFGDFTPDGQAVLLPHKTGVEFIETATGATNRIISLPIDRPIYTRSTSLPGIGLVFAESAGYVVVDLAAGRIIRPIGSLLAALHASEPEQVYTWHPAGGFREMNLRTGESRPLALGLDTADYWPDVRVIGEGLLSVWLQDSGLHTLSIPAAQPLMTMSVPISRFGFKPMADGRRFCTVERSGRVSLWSIARWNQPFMVSAPNRGLYGAAINHSATQSVVFGWGDVALFDVDTGENLWTNFATQGKLYAAAFTRDGRMLAVGGGADSVHVLESASGSVHARLRPPADALITALEWSPGGDRLIAGCFDGRVFEYSRIAPDAEPVPLPDAHGGPVAAARFSPDGQWLVTASDSGLTLKDHWHPKRGIENAVYIRRGDTGKKVSMVGDPAQPHGAIAIFSDGSRLVVGSERSVSMFRLADGQPIASEPIECAAKSVAIHPDGSRIAVYCIDGEIRVHNGEDLAFITQFRETGYGRQDVRFSPDGRTLVAACGYMPVTAFESRPPRDEDRRLLMRQASVAIGDLFDRLGHSADEVCEAIAAAGLPAVVREAALQQARTRGDDPNRIYNDAWIQCRATDKPVAFYEQRIRRVQAAIRGVPESALLHTTLAIAQMRARQHEVAIATCAESDRLIGDRSSGLRPINALVTSIGLSSLGRSAEARATIERAKQAAAETGSADNVDVRNLLQEAESLLQQPESK